MGTRKYNDEYKAQAVRLVREGGRSANAVSKEIGISQSVLSRWVRESQGGTKPTKPLSDVEKEVAQLRKENRQLKMERDFLRDAAGYFAKLKKSGSPQ